MKQGCPLSPLLFNLTIDELLEEVRKLKVGIDINQKLLCCMAFAVDLVLITEERILMEILLEHCKKFFDEKGLSVNVGKCESLRVTPVPKKQSMKVMAKHHQQWGKETIPPITFEELVRYLKVDNQDDGNVKLPRALRESNLCNLVKSHLNPIQKVEAIRQVLVTKIQYQLRLTDHGLEEARKINRLIRKYVKKILHLPTWTSTSWMYHRNGCNIPDLVTTTVVSRSKASTKMKTSTDRIVRYTGDLITALNDERLVRLNLQDINKNKEKVLKQLEKNTENQNNGKALLTVIQSKCKRSWLWTKRGLTPGNKLRLIQGSSGTLHININKTRGIKELNVKRCSRCRSMKIEDDAHILSACTFNKELITKRHDYVVKKLTKELKINHPDANIWRERSWRHGTEILRPDIALVEGDNVSIIQVTIPYEKSNTYLEQRRQDKIRKYEPLLQEDGMIQVQCTRGKVIPIAIGALGTVRDNTNKDLHTLKLQKQQDALQMIVATGTVNILNNHFRRDDFQ